MFLILRDLVYQAGMKVISFCLWDNHPMYNIGAIRNADLALSLYPGWECWFYVGSSTPKKTLEELEKRENCKILRMDDPGDWTGMFWRFYPASEEGVEVMISRDTDSRLSIRESAAVEEWLDSDDSFHIMRDHPFHGTPILGGMWGTKEGVIPDMKDRITQYTKGNYWQVDQNFLRDEIYPLVNSKCKVHDEFFEGKPFPLPREGKYFVGQAFNEFDEPLHPEHMDKL